MKYFLFIVSSLIASVSVAQYDCTVDLFLQADEPVNKMMFFNGEQTHMFDRPYADSIRITFSNNTSDVYNLWYFTDKRHRTQLWLDHGEMKIYASLKNGTLAVDSVKGSPLFYEFTTFMDTLLRQPDLTKIHKQAFISRALERNQDNLFGMMVAGNYSNIYKDDPERLLYLMSWMEARPQVIKDHQFFNLTLNSLTQELEKH